MKVVELNDESKDKALLVAENILKKGGVIIGPSDTVYGIYCDATNAEAIRKIFKIKKRFPEKALPIFVKDIATARRLAYIDDRKARFLEKVWPGPVTVVFHHKEKLLKVLTPHQSKLGTGQAPHQSRLPEGQQVAYGAGVTGQAGGPGTIGIRIPNHPFLLELLSRLDFPLAQTSANISGAEPIRSADEAAVDWKKERTIQLVIDGGSLPKESSTVVDFTKDNPIILRSGVVTKEELDKLFEMR